MYLYRAVDSEGSIIEFHLSKTRDKQAAMDFFKKALGSNHVSIPRVITVDKNPAYPIAIEQLKRSRVSTKGINNQNLDISLVLLFKYVMSCYGRSVAISTFLRNNAFAHE